jgi:hypothetical protein
VEDGRRGSARAAYDRAIAVVCLGGIAVTHLTDLPEKLEEAPYMAVLFCGLIISSAVLGILLATGRSVAMLWPLAGLLGALPLIGYVLSRSVALPQLEDHVGDWLSPAGVASLVFEAVLVAISVSRVYHLGGSSRQGTASAGPVYRPRR